MTADGVGGPVPYMARTRAYYRALGYESDYTWAHHDAAPFVRLARPVREARVALVTTAGPPDLANRDARGRKRPWCAQVVSPPAAFDTDVAWDRTATHVDDRETFLPIAAMQRLAAAGVVGGLTARFYGAPTEYSHRKTQEQDAPQILQWLREDGADAALLTAL